MQVINNKTMASVYLWALCLLYSPVQAQQVLMPRKNTEAKTPAELNKAVEAIVKNINLPSIPDRTFNVVDFGERSALSQNLLPAINQAIATASNAGGGKVVIPEGTWPVNGPIHLKSKINLHLEAGATLIFSPEPSHYLPVVKQRWEGTEVYNYSPLIYAANVEDIAISGNGTIDGNANSVFHSWHKKQNADISKLRKQGFSGVPLAERVYQQGSYLRPGLIQIFGAKRVLLEGYTAINAPFWVNHLVYTDHAIVRNLKVNSHFPNNDGIDVESSTYVLVENNQLSTGDDSVVIKSGRDLDGRTIARPSHHIVVKNNLMGGEDGIGLGSEMAAGISEVYFLQNTFTKGNAAFRFKSNLDRGGLVENIYIDQADVGEFDTLFWFQLNYPSELGGNFETRYRNIHFSNVKTKDIGTSFFIRAHDAYPLENVTFNQITIENNKQIFDVENAVNVNFNQVQIQQQILNGTMSWQSKKRHAGQSH
jgi:polygalacturonase